MRFMVMVKATKDSEAGVMPSTEEFAEMGRFNEELVKAGVMLAGEGLHPSSKGARVKFKGTERTVVDGPFAETKELVAGFWILQCRTRDEVIEWVKRRRTRCLVNPRSKSARFSRRKTSATRSRPAARAGRAAAHPG